MDYVRQFLLDQTGVEFFCLVGQIRHAILLSCRMSGNILSVRIGFHCVKTFADQGIRNIAFRNGKCSVKQTVIIFFFV